MIEPMSTIILDMAAKAFMSALAGKTTEKLLSKIRSQPTKRVFKKALASAIKRYATGNRVALARPLLQKNGPLTHDVVAEELAQIV